MRLQNNTILITGGSSGIGLELAKRFIANNNKVIICGRSIGKLINAREKFPQIDTFQCDISIQDERLKLQSWISENYPDCNILINNAAIVHSDDFYHGENMLEKANAEIQTNLMAPIALSKLFIPILESNNHPAIINITTGLIYAPRAIYPFYNTTKAALHSFTQVLRIQLEESPTRVFEVMFPAVDTPWHKGNAPKISMKVDEAVDVMLKGLNKGKAEIRVGKANLLYKMSRIAPQFALKKINSIR